MDRLTGAFCFVLSLATWDDTGSTGGGVPAAAERKTAAEPGLRAMPSDRVLRSLATQPITKVKKGQGGRTLAFHVVLVDGARAYFKPEQTFAANWFSEVASFHVDRLLGLYRVAPVVSRRLPWSAFAAAAANDSRRPEIRVARDGTVRGALIAWIDTKPVPLGLPDGWEAWLRCEEPPKISPFQRVDDWRRGRVSRRAGGTAPTPDVPERPAELSDLILFDYLIANLDRWGGGFTNVRTLGPGGPLIHLDNANGFGRGVVRTKLMDLRLHAVQRFRSQTIEAIAEFDVEALRARLAEEPTAPVLDDRQLAAFEARRRHVLEHVAEMRERFGAAARW